MINIILQSLIITAFEAISCKNFFDTFFNQKKYLNKNVKRTLVPTLILGFTIVAVLGIPNYLAKSLISILLIFTIIKCYYQTKFVDTLFLSLIYYGIMICVDYVAILVFNNILSEKYNFFTMNAIQLTLLTVLCKLILFILILVIRRLWNKEDNLSMISKYEWVYLLYLPTFTIFWVVAMLMKGNYYDIEFQKVLLLVTLGLTFMNLIVFYLIKSIVNKEAENRRNKLLQERVRNQLSDHHKMEEIYNKQRRSIHDNKSQLAYIQRMLVEGKVEDSINYITELTGKLANSIEYINTNNGVINSVINQKYIDSRDKDIVFTLVVNDLSNVRIVEEDIVIILSNVLDNAIEACEKLQSARMICCKFQDESNQLIVSVKNTTEEINIVNSLIATTKSNKLEHGIGLMNVKETVEKYKGNYVIKYENGWYYFSAIIPYMETSY